MPLDHRRRQCPLVLLAAEPSLKNLYDILRAAEDMEYLVMGPEPEGSAPKPLKLFIRLRPVSWLTLFSGEVHDRNILQYCRHQLDESERIKDDLDQYIDEFITMCEWGVDEVRPGCTIDHPVACIHAVSMSHTDPIAWLLDSQRSYASQVPLDCRAIMSRDILHYFVLVDGGAGNFDRRKFLLGELARNFGQNASVLSIGEKANESTREIEELMHSFVTASLVPFMQNFINSGQATSSLSGGGHASSGAMGLGLGLASRLISAGKKLIIASPDSSTSSGGAGATVGVDSPEFLLQRTADFCLMLGVSLPVAIDDRRLSPITRLHLVRTRLKSSLLLATAGSGSTYTAANFMADFEEFIGIMTKSPPAYIDISRELASLVTTVYVCRPHWIYHKHTSLRMMCVERLLPHLVTSSIQRLGLLLLSASDATLQGSLRASLCLHYRVCILAIDLHLVRLKSFALPLSNLSLTQANLAKLIILKMADWPLDYGYSKAHFSLLALNFQLTSSPQIAETLVNIHHKMIDASSQEVLIHTLAPGLLKPCKFLHVQEEHTFLSTNLLGTEAPFSSCSSPCSYLNDPNVRQRLHDLCATLTLRLEHPINAAALLANQSHLRMLPGERIFLQTVVQNNLHLALTLHDIILHFNILEEEGGDHIPIQVRETNVELPAASATPLTLSFEYRATRSDVTLKLAGLEASINGQVRLFVEVLGRGPRLNFTKEQRLSVTHANNPHHCFAVISPGPRLGLEVERSSILAFEGGEIQATAILRNTGDGPAHNCLIFATGIDSFPSEGLPAGTVEAASSVRIPLAYSVADEPLLLALCGDANLSTRAVFTYAGAPEQLTAALSARVLVVNESLLLSLTNETGQFMSNVTPTLLTTSETNFRDGLVPTPASIDLAPGHSTIFIYLGRDVEGGQKAMNFIVEDEQLVSLYHLSVDLDLGGIPVRIFVRDIRIKWLPLLPNLGSDGPEVQLRRIGDESILARNLPLSAAFHVKQQGPWRPRIMTRRGSMCEVAIMSIMRCGQGVEVGTDAFYYHPAALPDSIEKFY